MDRCERVHDPRRLVDLQGISKSTGDQLATWENTLVLMRRYSHGGVLLERLRVFIGRCSCSGIGHGCPANLGREASTLQTCILTCGTSRLRPITFDMTATTSRTTSEIVSPSGLLLFAHTSPSHRHEVLVRAFGYSGC